MSAAADRTPARTRDPIVERVRAEAAAELFGGAAPLTIGRYRVQARVGRGGNGVVYRAIDPLLGRSVAIKLVRAELAGPPDAHSSQLLLREAKVLAAVRHRNVLEIYDAGVHEDAPFLVTELVEGATLDRWCEGRVADDVLAVFREAARGLVAAHAAGVIHRDFKPANVLIAPQGAPGEHRVRVIDFGIARVLAPDDSRDGEAEPVGEGLEGADTIAGSGARVGTAPYMAPEQHDGGTVDARTDVYAFCVSLYATLSGTFPFIGAGLDELREAKRSEQWSLDSPRVPSWLRPVIRRGLRAQPALRYADVDELLRALAPPRRPLRKIAGATALVGALIVHVWASVPTSTELCTMSPPGDGGSLRARGRHDDRAATEALAGRFDELAAAWLAARASICVAELDPAARDCLMVARGVHERVLGSLVDSPRLEVEPALSAVAAIGDPAACGDRTPPTRDRDALAPFRELDPAARACVGAAFASTELDDPRGLAEAVDCLEALDHEPHTRAAAGLWRGRLARRVGKHSDALASFEGAFIVANEVGADGIAALAAGEAARVIDLELGQRERATSWRQHAYAAARRSGEPGRLAAELRIWGAQLDSAAGQPVAALVQVSVALDVLAAIDQLRAPLGWRARLLRAQLLGQFDRADVAERELAALADEVRALAGVHDPLLFEIGVAGVRLAKYEGRLLASASELWLRHRDASLAGGVGDDPRVLLALTSLAYLGHDLDAALALAQRAHAAVDERYGPQHWQRIGTESTLGNMLAERGQVEQAEQHFAVAEAIWLARGAPATSEALQLSETRGVLLDVRGDLSGAAAMFERCAHMAALLPGERVRESHCLANLAYAWDALGEHARAVEVGERVIARDDLEPPSRALLLANHGIMLAKADRRGEAMDTLERALALALAQGPAGEHAAAQARRHLSEVLWDDPRTRPRARELAAEARAYLERDSEHWSVELAELESRR